MSWRRGAPCLVLVMSFLWTACGSVPEIRYYTLGGPNARPAAATAAAPGAEEIATGWTLGVERLAVEAPYNQDRLVYRPSENSAEVGFYEQTRWAAHLNELVSARLVDALRQVEGLTLVEPASRGRDYDLRLRGRIEQAEQIDLAPERVSARWRLSIQMLDSDDAIVWSDTVEGVVDGPATDGAQVMGLMSQALEQAMDAFGGQLEGLELSKE